MPGPWVYGSYGVTLQLSVLPSLSEAPSFCFRGHYHQLVSLLYISNPLVASWVSLPLFYPLKAVSSEGEPVSFLKRCCCLLVFHIWGFFCLSALCPSCTFQVFVIMAHQWDAPAGHNDSQSQFLVNLGFQPTEVVSHIYRLLRTEATLVNEPRADLLLMRKAKLHM